MAFTRYTNIPKYNSIVVIGFEVNIPRRVQRTIYPG